MIAKNEKEYRAYIRGHGSIVSDRVYIPIASFLVERIFMKFGIPPTPVTLLSIIFGVLSVIAFLFGNWSGFLMGAILLQISYILDCADGQVARLRNMQSDFGGTLDFISDLAIEMPLYFVITLALYLQFRAIWIWIIGFGAIYGIFMSHYLLRYADTLKDTHNYTTPRDVIKNKLGVSGKHSYFGGGTNTFLLFFGAVFFSITPSGIFNSMCVILLFLAGIYNFHWIAQFSIILHTLKREKGIK